MSSNRLRLAPGAPLPLGLLRQLPALRFLNLGGAQLACSLAPAPADVAQAAAAKAAAELQAAAAGAAAAAGEANMAASPFVPFGVLGAGWSSEDVVAARPSSASTTLAPLASPRSSPRFVAARSEPNTPIATAAAAALFAPAVVSRAWRDPNSPTPSPTPSTAMASALQRLLVPALPAFSRWPSGLVELRLFQCGLEGQLPLDLGQLRRIKVWPGHSSLDTSQRLYSKDLRSPSNHRNARTQAL